MKPRFIIDHGVIHDLATGKHVRSSESVPNEDGMDECCALLNSLAGEVAAVTRERDEAREQRDRVIAERFPTFAHDEPYRALHDNEIAKLQALCDSRSYLYWWDMGSALLTLAGVTKERDALLVRIAELEAGK